VQGIVCLHDFFLGHLFWGWSEIISREKAHLIIESRYGTQVSRKFFDHGDSASFIAYAAAHAPMTEWVASMASAVVVHSPWALDRITASCLGPVEVIPLPYDAPEASKSLANKDIPDQTRAVLLTIGHVNANKRYVQIIEAIGSSPVLRDQICYQIVGQIEPQTVTDLQLLADKYKVSIVITGAVDDDRLVREIQSADIMCCLRWPALEAASASTIEAMLYGKPTLVTETGFYRSLPDSTVLKVSPEAELPDLQRHLESLVADPARRDRIGKAARDYARNTFRADVYAERLVQVKQKVNRAAIVSHAARVFSQQLKSWGAKPNSGLIEAVAAPLSIIK
jgi:glycosyltransferase involved in cell wall biosynthesis